MYKISEVTPGEGLTLHLTYTDGATVHVDVSSLLDGDPGVFVPLRERAFFERVQVGPRGRTITWPGELDLDADVFRMDPDDPYNPSDFRILASTPPEPADPVSVAIAQAVKLVGLPQRAVAERAGMQQPNLARMMDPEYHGHSMSALRRVADALGMEIEFAVRPRDVSDRLLDDTPAPRDATLRTTDVSDGFHAHVMPGLRGPGILALKLDEPPRSVPWVVRVHSDTWRLDKLTELEQQPDGKYIARFEGRPVS